MRRWNLLLRSCAVCAIGLNSPVCVRLVGLRVDERGGIDLSGGECGRHRRRRHLDEVEVAAFERDVEPVDVMQRDAHQGDAGGAESNTQPNQ